MAPRPGLNRAIIVQAAGTLADDVGLEGLTLSAVAAHLGVRTPSLYNHVDGLGGLHRELSLFGIRALDARLRTAAVGKSRGAALRSMLHAYRLFAKERPGVYAATLRAPAVNDAEIQTAATAIVDTVLTVLEPYQLSHADEIHAVRGFRAIGHGFAGLEAADAFGIPLAVDDSYQYLISAFLRGLDALGQATGE